MCSPVISCLQISVLQSIVKEGNRDKCLQEVELVVAATKQIREEVRQGHIMIFIAARLFGCHMAILFMLEAMHEY